MKRFDLVVMGGGAAGMMAAALALDLGLSVAIVEKRNQCGSKLLLTGKGKCNITNTFSWQEFSPHIYPNSSFFKTAFYQFSNQDTINFFEKIGLETVIERGSRVFPRSGRSHDVRDSLVSYIKKMGGVINVNTEVSNIEKKEDLFMTSAIDARNQLELYLSTNVLIASGGLSYPITGSTGKGYELAKRIGHKIEDTFPSLTALKPYFYDPSLQGVALKNVKLDLYVDSIIRQSEFGELSFTNGGIEGALGFRISRKAVRGIDMGNKVEVSIDLKPGLTIEQLSARITREVSDINSSKRNNIEPLRLILQSMLPLSLIKPFIDSLSELNIMNLPFYLKNWKFKIKSYVGYDRCVITAGGISLREISRKTMESKLLKNLYFAGEIVDLDGDTGGYNLQIAFSTAALAVSSMSASLPHRGSVTREEL